MVDGYYSYCLSITTVII